jgi:4-amino-4-deoxy-L-arabinose transferase-like glycosyltransferase
MKDKSKDRILFFILAAILLGAFLLRIQQWDKFTITDEQSQALWTWDLFHNPFPVIAYPPLILYFNFFLSLFLKAVFSFLGFIPFAGEFVNSGQGFLIHIKASQLLMALFGTFHVYLVFRIGREFYNRGTAFLAATLMAVNQFMILNNHSAKNDTFLSLFLTLSLYFIFKYTCQSKIRQMFWGSLFFGLAVAAKYNAALAAAFIIAALLFAARPLKSEWRRLLTTAGAAAAGALTGFFLGAPNWLIHPLANARAALADVTFLYSSFSLYDKPSPTFHLYIVDFIYNFGLIFFIIFIIGMLAIFISKRKTDMLLAVFFFAYMGFFGRSGFYGYGTPLPIYPAMILLMAKTLFLDLPSLISRWPKFRKILLPLLWLPIVAFAAGHGARSIELFNILKTASQVEQAWYYRIQHIPKGFRFASEMYTQQRGGDSLGNPDLTHIKLRYFQNYRPILFIASSFRSEYILNQTKNKLVKKDLHERLQDYTPFHKIQKIAYPPGSYDIQFWYKTPKSLRRIHAPQMTPAPELPRQFLAAPGLSKTIFLPLQVYEKNPNSGKTENGSFTRWLYSTSKIEKINFSLFALQDNIAMKIIVNNQSRDIYLPKAMEVVEIEMTGIKPKPLHADFVYNLEVITAKKGASCYFAFFPDFISAIPLPAPQKFPVMQNVEPIPAMFSGTYPPWLVEFYKKTGIDLALLEFVNREYLVRNEQQSSKDINGDFLPLAKGFYKLQISGSPLLKNFPIGNEMRLKLTLASSQGLREENISLAGLSQNGSLTLKLTSGHFTFLKYEINGLRENNFLLQDFVMLPDYQEYLKTFGE